MVEPVVTVGTAAAMAYLGKDGLSKLLGPTCEYLGGEIQNFVEKCNINIGEILIKAHKKVGLDIYKAGGVSPRILKTIINEGAFCENDMVQEYYAGILAGSRSEKADCELGLGYANLLSNLSSEEIRFHYFAYYFLKKRYDSRTDALDDGVFNFGIAMSLEDFAEIMGLSNCDDACALCNHIAISLSRHSLLKDVELTGMSGRQKDFNPTVSFRGTKFGASLFLWANGESFTLPEHLFLEDILITSPRNIDINKFSHYWDHFMIKR